MSDLEDMLKQLDSVKPEPAVIVNQEEQQVEVKKEVKKRKKKKDVKNDDLYIETMLKDVPTRSRVHCSICKKMLNQDEQNWYMRTEDGLEYWWCRKCIK